ncbi:M4 family metallopeptidase [Actinoplanes sp. LDG1-06]|uniref:M4 family metallopeptidase n=1 Tax=Paractinoplanes ovalisporus TaxID=2810368 RepID=A0ABS2AEH8_9ACTN|nr:M4 family metallopeptidase [Actinoplanes ovalisporus]MBM2618237.1 M4 family metallopeptidase [Actinoplanes ovalisporus]
MTVWRGNSRGILATVAAAALIGAGAAIAVSGPSGSTGTLTVARGGPATPESSSPPVEAGRSTPPAAKPAFVAAARAAVTGHKTAVRAGNGEKYQAKDVVVDADGGRHVRFERTWKGLDVLGGDFVVHTTGSGSFTGATVAQTSAIEVGREPEVTRGAAVAAAQREHSGRAEARLVVDASAGEPVLAWEVTVAGRHVVVVDATTAAVRRSWSLVKTADEGTGHGVHTGDVKLATTRTGEGAFELTDAGRGGGTTRDALNNTAAPTRNNSKAFTDADDVWGNGSMTDRASAAVDVHYGMARTWDYFDTTFGRSGMGGDGKGVTAYVHHDVNDANAAWGDSCRCMYFGDGFNGATPWTSLDIVAHEWAHGFNLRTADLDYTGEAGGLNEASSDIFGTLVEFAVNSPADPPDYLVAEKVETDPLRYMDDPHRDGVSPSCWSSSVKNLDVHYSSGIGNKFFYNLAVGSGTTRWGTSTPCGTAGPVTGIGNEAAAQIWYRAMTAYMVSNTNYSGARKATLQAATDLYGAASAERAAVQAAWLAVGVTGSDPVPVEPVKPVVEPYKLPDTLVGQPVEFQMTGHDPQRQPITWYPIFLPTGLAISPSGLITGTPTEKKQWVVSIGARDPDGNLNSAGAYWFIKGPPVLVAPPADGEFHVGEPASASVTFDDGADATLDTLNPMKVEVTGLPEGLTAATGPVTDNKITATVTGTPTKAGTGTAVYTVTDADGGTATASQPWTVGPRLRPTAPEGVTVTAGAGTALIKWDAPPADGPEITGYVVRSQPGGEQTLPATARSVTLTGLNTTQAYTFGVKATSGGGDSTEKQVRVDPTALTIAPASLIAGYTNPVTLTGSVIRDGDGPVGGAQVHLEQQTAGTTTWTRVTTVKTGAAGNWSHVVNPAVTTSYRVVFPAGASDMWPATSPVAAITVRYAVTVTPSTTSTTATRPVTFTGTIRPATPGVIASLQRYTDGEWVTIQSTPATTSGSYSISRAFARGTWNLRVVASGGGTNAYGFTSAVRLTVS